MYQAGVIRIIRRLQSCLDPSSRPRIRNLYSSGPIFRDQVVTLTDSDSDSYISHYRGYPCPRGSRHRKQTGTVHSHILATNVEHNIIISAAVPVRHFYSFHHPPQMNQSRGNARGSCNNVRRGRAGYRVGVSSSARHNRGGPGSTHRGAPSGAPIVYKEEQSAQVDTRLHTADELVTRLQGLNLGPQRPPRPGWGTLGRVSLVRTNFFPIELLCDTYYDYVVQISPEPKSQKARVKRRVLALFEQNASIQPYINKIAHDGAQRLISAQPLPQPLLGNVEYFEDGDDGPPQNADRYSVEVKFSRELPTAPLKLCV